MKFTPQSELTQWNFVNGRINPDDIGHCSMDIVGLSGCNTCWNSPEFLHGNKTGWPQEKFKLAEKSTLEFKNTVKTYMGSVTHQTVPHQQWRLDCNRLSNWKGLLRVTVWVKQFFLKIGIHFRQGWTASMRHGVTRKRSTNWLQHTGNLFRKNLQLKGVCYF